MSRADALVLAVLAWSIVLALAGFYRTATALAIIGTVALFTLNFLGFLAAARGEVDP